MWGFSVLSIPDELRGRVTAVTNIGVAAVPLGGPVAGIGSDLLGGPKMITIFITGAAAVVAIIAFLWSFTMRYYRFSEGIRAISSRKPSADAPGSFNR